MNDFPLGQLSLYGGNVGQALGAAEECAVVSDLCVL